MKGPKEKSKIPPCDFLTPCRGAECREKGVTGAIAGTHGPCGTHAIFDFWNRVFSFLDVTRNSPTMTDVEDQAVEEVSS